MSGFYDNSTTVDSGGVRLRVAKFGPADGPAVLLLHGWPDSGELWSGQIGPLTEAGFRVIAPDQRGFGASDRPSEVANYRMFSVVDDAVAVLDALGCDTAHVVGHDWGAAVAWGVAGFSPARVRSLTVLSVGHPSSFASAGLEQKMLSWYMLAFQFPGITEEWLMRDDWAVLREFLSSHPHLEQVVENLSQPGALTASLNWYRANAAPESLLGEPGQWPSIEVDVMGIWSSGDLALTEGQMTGSAEHVAGAWRYERIEDASHWLQLDAGDAVNGLALDWLGQH